MKMKKILFCALLLGFLGSNMTVMAQILKPVEDLNKVTDLTLDSLDKVRSARIKPGTSRQGSKSCAFPDW